MSAQDVHGVECGRRDRQGKSGGVQGPAEETVFQPVGKWERIGLLHNPEKGGLW